MNTSREGIVHDMCVQWKEKSKAVVTFELRARGSECVRFLLSTCVFRVCGWQKRGGMCLAFMEMSVLRGAIQYVDKMVADGSWRNKTEVKLSISCLAVSTAFLKELVVKTGLWRYNHYGSVVRNTSGCHQITARRNTSRWTAINTDVVSYLIQGAVIAFHVPVK
jgi:hypothetical protein